MEYVVFEDLRTKNGITKPSDTSVKIHKATCRFYVNRDANASTVQWHGTFDTAEKAEEYAKQLGKPYRRAKCCLKIF